MKDKKGILALLTALADFMESRGLNELEIEHDGDKFRLCKGGGVVSVRDMSVAALSDSAVSAAPADAAALDSWSEHAGAVKSPIVGTVYLSPRPGSAPFVAVGDSVSEGQTLLIVEAMKVMNSIQAHCSGVLKHLPVSNGDPVEYGQVLAVIE